MGQLKTRSAEPALQRPKSTLSLVEDTKRSEPWRFLVYGPHGVGKSTFGADPVLAPIFLDLEDGLATIEAKRFPRIASTQDFARYVDALIDEEHPFKTLVVDSIDWLEKLVHEEVAREAGKKSVGEIDFGKGYARSTSIINACLQHLDALRRNAGMNILMIGHSTIEHFEDPSTEPYDRYIPRLHKGVNPVVCEWCDAVLFATFRIGTKESDGGFGRKRVRAVGRGDRILLTEERPSHRAKNRYSFPFELPMTWDAILPELQKEENHG